MATEQQSPQIQNIEELIKPFIENKPKHVTYTAVPLTAEGENYGSLLYALEIQIEYENKQETKQMVAKLCPKNEWLKRMFASHVTFKKEIGFYLDIIPILINFQKEHNVQEENLLKFFPKCLNARINLNPSETQEVDENAIILLENLKLENYKLLNRHEGLGYPETVIVLKSLARFHAVPLSFKLQKPDEFAKIMPLLNRVSIGQEMFDMCPEKFNESLYRHLDLSQEKLERFIKGMEKGYNFQRNFPTGNEKYATIVHCDFWLNNTMLKYENDKPIQNKMLDFQVNTYGNPLSDLVFFLFTSVHLNVLQKCYDELLQVYYNEFNDCLKELHCDTSDYTFQSLMDELNIYGPLEASHILVMFKAVFTVKIEKKLEDLTMDDMFTNDGITEIYLNRLKWTVQEFFNKNWF